MAVAIKIVLNSAGIQRMLKSEAISNRVNAEAHKIAAAMKTGRAIVSEIGPHRSRAAVIAYGDDRSVEEAQAALLEALDAAGGGE